jgi:hypothetical protein
MDADDPELLVQLLYVATADRDASFATVNVGD